MHLVAILFGDIGATWWLNKNTVESGDTKAPGVPKIAGYDARYVGMAAGLLVAVTGIVGGPIGAAIVGAGLASYNSMDAANRWSKSFDEFLAAQASRTGDDGAKALADRRKLLSELERGFDFMSGDFGLNGAGVSKDYAPGPMPGIC